MFAFNATFATTKKETETNSKSIEVLQATKVDRTEFNMVSKQLDEIQKLLIEHMNTVHKQ